MVGKPPAIVEIMASSDAPEELRDAKKLSDLWYRRNCRGVGFEVQRIPDLENMTTDADALCRKRQGSSWKQLLRMVGKNQGCRCAFKIVRRKQRRNPAA